METKVSCAGVREKPPRGAAGKRDRRVWWQQGLLFERSLGLLEKKNIKMKKEKNNKNCMGCLMPYSLDSKGGATHSYLVSVQSAELEWTLLVLETGDPLS